MNKIVSKFAFVLRSRRKERRMTQKALGQLTRLSSKLISKFENGDQIPNKLQRTSLEDVLGRLPTPTRFRPPRHNNAWRELFKDKRSWKRHRDRSFTSRLKTARIHYAHEIRKLKPAIDDHEPWMEASDSGSCLELVTCSAIFAIEGAVELSVRPISWGFRKLAVCDQVTGEIMADKCFPAIGLAWDACHAVLIPQVPLLTKDGPIVVDFLVCIRVGSRCIWFALEIDGPGHSSKADELRAAHLPAVRVTEAEIVSPGFHDILRSRLLSAA